MKQKVVTLLACFSVICSSFLSGLFIVFPKIAKAYSSPGSPTGFVNDFAGVINTADKAAMEAELQSFSDETSNQIVVATVKDLGGDSIENYSNELFREWGVGNKGLNNGVLIVVAPTEHKVRIEVGYGLEGAITDLASSHIINDKMIPYFKSNDYASGLEAGIADLKLAAKGEYSVPVTKKSSSFSFDTIFGDSLC